MQYLSVCVGGIILSAPLPAIVPFLPIYIYRIYSGWGFVPARSRVPIALSLGVWE